MFETAESNCNLPADHQTDSLLEGLMAPLNAEIERQERVFAGPRIAHPNAVHGLPITPKRELLKLQNGNFCVSFWRPEQLETAISLLAPDSILMLDNGAFSAWRSGQTLSAEYWETYWEWALPVLDRVEQAIAVIPDLIDGSEAENHALVHDAISRHPWPESRLMPVWHLHESLDYLDYLVHCGFGFIGFGSSGEFAQVGTPQWRHRITEAFEQVERSMENWASARARIHMMRGLGQIAAGEFPFATADSTNLARNHCNSTKRGIDIEQMRTRIEQYTFPAPQGAFWPQNTWKPAPPASPAPRQHKLL